MASAIFFFIVLSLLPIYSVQYSSGNNLVSALYPAAGTYIMKAMIGSPPIETPVIMDTGSDLMWVQCTPCEVCYPQKLPIFDPTRSSTYKNVSCHNFSSCPYERIYADSSKTTGVMGMDTITFTSAENQFMILRNVIFGCGHNNGGFFPIDASGLFGFGRGKRSFVSQLGSKLGKMFSYCLVESTANASGLLQIGRSTSTSGDGYVSTPLLAKKTNPSFYYLVLKGISVGGAKVSSQKTPPNDGNIIIDSGTTLTYLDPEVYQNLEKLVKQQVLLEPVKYPEPGYSLCYEKNSFNNIKDMKITFHFQGADIDLKKVNLFREEIDMMCFTMMPSADGLNIYGNSAQVNFHIVYDLKREQISFVPTDCATYHTERNDGQKLMSGRPFLYLIVLVLFLPI